MTTATATRWQLQGRGYEFCNCDFGCGCNFGGFPNSKDGSCRAFVGVNITRGTCGDVDLAGVKCAGREEEIAALIRTDLAQGEFGRINFGIWLRTMSTNAFTEHDPNKKK